jgi:hypothetical protein
MAKNGWTLEFEDTCLHNFLFYAQIYSIGNKWCSTILCIPMVSPKEPATLKTPHSYPMGNHSHSFVSKNGQKRLKNVFWGKFLPWPLILNTICSMDQWVVYNYPMILPKVPSTLVTLYRYPMGSHSHSFVSKNGRIRLKQFFDKNSYQNLLFYTQVCSMGQWMVFNYPMILPKVLTTLMIPHSYPMGHHSHSFVSKIGEKRLNTGIWGYLPP